MNSMIAWFARNGVAANLLLLAIVVAGLFTIGNIKQEIFPEVDTGLVSVAVEYPGASPEEIEESIVVRIEEQLQGVDGVKRIRSTAAEGAGVVVVELMDDADVARVLDDVKNRVDAIDTFPEEAEKPTIEEVLLRRAVLTVAVSGSGDERTLKTLGQRIRDEITMLPGITQAELVAARPFEISIEVSEEALQRYGLSFDQVAQAVARSSLDLPGGLIRGREGEILLRTKGQAYRGEEFEDLPVVNRPDGTRLRLRDVAKVRDAFADADLEARFDGEPSVLVEVYRVGSQSAPDISTTVRDYVDSMEGRLPEGISLTVWNDDTRILEARRDTLINNGMQGFLLVLISLALFLRLRIALWVAAGVPVSVLGALWLMPQLGVTVNLLSLFAFIVVIGILVDDAIVTGENVYRLQTEGMDPERAAIEGTQEVSTPVTFGMLTTVAAFLPLLTLPGTFGKLSVTIPVVVISALAVSLIESKFCLPYHLAHAGDDGSAEGNALGRRLREVQDAVSRGLQRFLATAYGPFLERAIAWRWLTLSIGIAVLIVSLAYVAGGHIRFVFFPAVEGDNVVALLTMPEGTSADVTRAEIERIAAAGEEIRREIDGVDEERDSVFEHVLATVGDQPFRQRQSRDASDSKSGATAGHLGEVNVMLVPSEKRDVSSEEVARRWRERVGEIPDAVELSFTASLFSTGKAIDLQLEGANVAELRMAAEALKAKLRDYEGVYDVSDSFREGKRELRLAILPAAEASGLTLRDLARQVRQAFYGEEAQRIQRGQDDVKVMVRFPEEARRSLGDLEAMRIRLPDGTAVPFASVARADLGSGTSTIKRSDRRRIIHVTAEVDLSRANPNEVLASLRADSLPRILAEHPGVSYGLEGEQREQNETLDAMRGAFGMALLSIFALLAIPLRSWTQPFLIMSAIPFGIVGAIWGHVLFGRDLSMLSVIGMVALSGVVVNDSLVLIDWMNAHVSSGLSLEQAARRAGADRFRAVLLTSLTTVLGLVPMLAETSVQAQFLIPMAISVASGLTLATAVTLILVPCATLALDDVVRAIGRGARRLAGRGGAAGPGAGVGLPVSGR
ncbi:Multidrug resistance protein MexB [Myxococcaceae bacterium]|nr:Multidrug resistance protein MexB [Myxococcaceae bacterium]